MAATSQVLTAVLLFLIFTNIKGKYKQIEIEIAGKNENEPAKIFSESELRQFDGSDVRLTNMFFSEKGGADWLSFP